MLQYARCPKNLTRTLVPFCRDLTICVTWNIYSCFKEAVMMTRSTAVELDRRREDWVAPYQDGTEESREGKNWGENPWTCWKVWAKLFRARAGLKHAHALSPRVLVRRSNFHSVFAIIDMRLLGSCPFHPVSIFRPGPIFAAQCSGIFAERIMGASTLVEYCGSLHTRWYCSTVWLWTWSVIFIWQTFLVKFCAPMA